MADLVTATATISVVPGSFAIVRERQVCWLDAGSYSLHDVIRLLGPERSAQLKRFHRLRRRLRSSESRRGVRLTYPLISKTFWAGLPENRR